MEHMGRQVWRRETSGPVGRARSATLSALIPHNAADIQQHPAGEEKQNKKNTKKKHDGYVIYWNSIKMAQNSSERKNKQKQSRVY